MSRGHGAAQRFILSVIDDSPGRWWSAWELAEARWGRGPTRAEVQAMRNGIRRLKGSAGVAVEELEPYWGVIGQLQDADNNWRPKRVFPTLYIRRAVPKREYEDTPAIQVADDDAGF